jgi:dTDP-4-dehydrorhamnose 3,5-epimerase
MPFEFVTMDIPGPVLVKPRIFGDARGFFLELYKHSDYAAAGIKEHLVQDNYSRSSRGVLRGLHFQKPPFAQGKLVTCLRGSIYDVAVDIRKGSPYFGKCVGVELTDENRHLFFVPAGFAHGFQVVSDLAEVMYKCTSEYSPQNEDGFIWDDPDIAVPWPITKPYLSAKDLVLPRLKDSKILFTFNGEP